MLNDLDLRPPRARHAPAGTRRLRPRRATANLRLALFGVVLLACAPFAAGAEPPPPDLHIVLRSAPRLPGAAFGEQSVEIDAQGNARLAAVKTPEGELPALTVKLPPEAVEDIWSWIQRERFFELDPLYRDPEIQDGDFAEMTVAAGGRTHTVRTVNIRVHAFDRIATVINYYLPDGREIQYNALTFPQYKSVER